MFHAYIMVIPWLGDCESAYMYMIIITINENTLRSIILLNILYGFDSLKMRISKNP